MNYRTQLEILLKKHSPLGRYLVSETFQETRENQPGDGKLYSLFGVNSTEHRLSDRPVRLKLLHKEI